MHLTPSDSIYLEKNKGSGAGDLRQHARRYIFNIFHKLICNYLMESKSIYSQQKFIKCYAGGFFPIDAIGYIPGKNASCTLVLIFEVFMPYII